MALLIGVFVGLLSYVWQSVLGASDVYQRLWAARALFEGRDPYATLLIYQGKPAAEYPLWTILFFVPFSFLPDILASALFFGLSSAWLMYAIIENGKPYMQLIFLSGAYFVAFGWQQFSVLNAVALLIPVTIPLSLLKPQTGLPVILTRLTARGVIASIVVVLLSFVINPGWPLAWYNTARNFDGVIPLLTLPLGPLMLLALINWRNPDAWVLLLFACVPQRSVYDLVPLLLLAKSGKQMGLFMILSWLPVLLGFSVLAVPSINVHYSLAFIYLPILIMQLYTSRKQPC